VGLSPLVSGGTFLAHAAVIATAAAALGIVASFGRDGPRPLGLAWDLMCFLPRAAHPFSPPCYAERAVPEISGRVRRWLATPGHHVVLSAHSLGAVLAVAVVYRLDAESRARLQLITYGVQLRAYFGRIFADLLGPNVLGTPACRAATLFGRDPWTREIAWKRPTEQAGQDTLRDRLPRSWINLWRRTDYLGFPAAGYQDNDLDSLAEEWVGMYDAAAVGTHGNYPRTSSYRDALDRAINAAQGSSSDADDTDKTQAIISEPDADSAAVGAAATTNVGAADAVHALSGTDHGGGRTG
jgi:hypothetical protein